ncbi:MAG TPA: hypothetical protein VN619_01830 [Lacisediminihabitans sp.]|jgi:hypothetical protein|nr:hypothetical protein [Lacisediminihabitans sp.]HXD60645.1 hypothetical protein [Lacisediminihabitans sp.]
MIEWGNFLAVLIVTVVGACGIVLLFALGLRLLAAESRWRRPLGVTCFVVCALLILYGIYLIIPGLSHA